MAVIKKIDLINDRSDLVQEILERKPNWFVYWGGSLMLILMVLVLILGSFIEYPDIIKARVSISSAEPPVPIVALVSGNIELYVTEGQHVKHGELLGFVRSSVDVAEAQQLEQILARGILDISDSATTEKCRSLKNLGSLQDSFNRFIEAQREYAFNISLMPFERERKALKIQLEEKENLEKTLQARAQVAARQYELAQKIFTRRSTLHNSGVVTAEEFEKSESELLGIRGALEDINIMRNQNLVSIAELKTSLVKLENVETERLAKLKSSVAELHKALLSEIRQWELMYSFRAPIEGKVSFHSFWHTGQFANSGTEVMMIAPSAFSTLIGRAECPIYNSGKIALGQKVNILLDSYPFEEYGMIVGTVTNVTEVPRKEVYSLEISLDHGLVTTYKKDLTFRQNMLGVGEIITEDISLVKRAFRRAHRQLRER